MSPQVSANSCWTALRLGANMPPPSREPSSHATDQNKKTQKCINKLGTCSPSADNNDNNKKKKKSNNNNNNNNNNKKTTATTATATATTTTISTTITTTTTGEGPHAQQGRRGASSIGLLASLGSQLGCPEKQ
ncbi:unnamed protein product [Polarella glacialis]|uniref:Uncharacterized protein n=1 Tax=Polarella glacialis TaxID=89957 RepID=A0A813F9J5_POLGL|nr:unnamed protein product [Polarella glacialis]